MNTFLKPYSWRRHNSTCCFWNPIYAIVFDETTIRYVGSKKEANVLIGLLNGAYNLGRMDESVQQSISGKPKVTWGELGDWYNTLIHSFMYIDEGCYNNAKAGIESVFEALEKFRNKMGSRESFRSLSEKYD